MYNMHYDNMVHVALYERMVLISGNMYQLKQMSYLLEISIKCRIFLSYLSIYFLFVRLFFF